MTGTFDDWDKEVEANLYETLGKAMSEWSGVEGSLLSLFQIHTSMPHALARRVFFSARSFNGRADMLSAAAVGSDQSDDLKDYTKAVITKARQYSAFRNALAHGHAAVIPRWAGTAYDNQGVILEERESGPPQEGRAITVPQIENAIGHFFALALITTELTAWEAHPELPPSRYAPLVRGLPSAPHLEAATLLHSEAFRQLLSIRHPPEDAP